MRMEMIYMEAKLFMKMMERFEVFASKVNTICGKNNFPTHFLRKKRENPETVISKQMRCNCFTHLL